MAAVDVFSPFGNGIGLLLPCSHTFKENKYRDMLCEYGIL